MNRIIKNITFLFLLLLTVGAVRAQVDDKGVTSTGKEVDCSTINPSVDQAVDQYGAIVTRPTLTRNGKLITRDCYCPFDLGDGNASITDFVYCTSVKMFAELSYRDPEARELPKNARVYVFTDAAYTHCVDTVEPAVIEHLEGKDTLTVDITGLSCYTRYYFRLVATNTTECVFDWTDSTRDMTMEKPTACDVLLKFANEHSSETGTIDSVYDHEGNAYAVVQIGNQCWLKENMRCTTSPRQGTDAGQVNLTQGSVINVDIPYYYDYSTTEGSYPQVLSLRERGLLYNWPAAIDSSFTSSTRVAAVDFSNRRGICPMGWHLPTDEEWMTMEKTVAPDAADINITNALVYQGQSTALATMLAGGCDWKKEPMNPNTASDYSNPKRNISGFTMLPAGYYSASGTANRFNFSAGSAFFWSATSSEANKAFDRNIDYDKKGVFRGNYEKSYGRSVRCVRNASATISFNANGGTGTMQTMDVKAMKDTTLNTMGGISHAGTNFEFAGWNTKADGTGISYPDGALINVINDVTLYAQWNSWCSSTNLLPNERGGDGKLDSVYDDQGNDYSVVLVGGQCWMKQNLRTKVTGDYGYPTVGGSTVVDSLFTGRLYTWNQIMNGSPSGANVRGICPIGWHIPTNAEWNTLMTYVNSNFQCNGSNTIAKALVTTAAWNANNVTCTPCCNPSSNNATGLSLYPAGFYRDYNRGYHSQIELWSATMSSSKATCYFIDSSYTNMGSANYAVNSDAYAVRCVRNTPDTITFMSHDGTGTIEKQFVNSGEKTALDSNQFTRDNFIFTDWSTDPSGCGTRYNDGDTIITNGNVTLYAQWDRSFCTGSPTGNESGNGRIDSVYDHEGNAYAVVQIGNQCWLKENMRATTNLSGTSILKNSSEGTSTSEPRAYYYNDNNSNLRKYGCLYNFLAAYSICPNGWHLPISTDWILLASSAQVELLYEERNYTSYTNGLGKLTGGCDWLEYNIGTFPGNYTYSDRNCTGFTAIPAGYLDGNNSGFLSRNEVTNFWGCLNDGPLAFHFSVAMEHILAADQASNPGYSVRCVRNN